MKKILTNPHCTAGTLGHHCAPGTLGFHHGTMGFHHGTMGFHHGTMGSTSSTIAKSFLVAAGITAAYTVGGVLNAAGTGYFGGRARKKGLTYKTIAKRNAALGGAVGAIVAAAMIAGDEN